jgi:hypothetical protein
MEEIIGTTNKKISKLDYFKFKIKLIKYDLNYYKRDFNEEKPRLAYDDITSQKKIVYFEHEGEVNSHSYFHCSLNRFYHKEQYFYFSNTNEHHLSYNVLKHAYHYNSENETKTCIYSKNSKEHHPINFFNDMFDTLSVDEIYEILNQPNVQYVEHYIKDASFLLKLLCLELKNKREKGINIDTKSISMALEHFSLFSKNEEYTERLMAMPISHTFEYKHNVLKGIIENQYLDLLFEAEQNKLISNDSPIKIRDIIEYKYNYIIYNIPKEINAYILKVLNNVRHDVQVINFNDYCEQNKEIIANKNESIFFNILKDVEKGSVDLILSKSILTDKVYSYINKKFKIDSQHLLNKDEHLLFHDRDVTIIEDLFLKEYSITSTEHQKQDYIIHHIESDFNVLKEQKYLSSVLTQSNDTKEKIIENKKRKKI